MVQICIVRTEVNMVDGRLTQALLDDDPRTRALQNLKEAVELNLRELDHAFKQRPMGMVALITRNLLELLVWVEYCQSSQERAKRFCEDSLRDALDMLKLRKEFATERERLIKMLKHNGIKNPEDSFFQVRDAAEELHKKDCFVFWNKLFSKFAHPTALAVMNDLPSEDIRWFKSSFFELGMGYGVSALAQIDRCLQELPLAAGIDNESTKSI